MTAKSRILATIVGFVVLFMLGWLFYGLLLMDFYEANTGSATNVARAEEDMVWWALILGNFLQAYFLVYVFSKWPNITTFGAGAKAGFVLGLILGLAFNLTMYATTNMMNMTAMLVDPFVSAVMMAGTGGVIGMILGRQ